VRFPARLRLGNERHGEDAEGAEEGAAVHYSITWSARCSNDGKIVGCEITGETNVIAILAEV